MVFDSLGKDIKNLFRKPANGIKKQHGASFITKLPSYKKARMVVIGENIAEGEHIRKYVIEAKIRGKWRQITDGESIGHKRIPVFDTVYTNLLRFRVVKSAKNVRLKTSCFIELDRFIGQ